MRVPIADGPLRTRRLALAFCRALLDETGGAFAETILVTFFLVIPLILGTADMGTLMYDSIEVSNAAHAGALTAMDGTNTSANIQAAALADAPDLASSMIATNTQYYACSVAEGGTTYSTLASATTGCTGTGNHPVQFVKVTVSATLTLPYHCCTLPATLPLGATSVMEVQ